MSVFSEQITQLLKDKLEFHNGNLNAQLQFDKNFIGFKGHFPGNPVLPGVVMIKVMTRMYEVYKKKEYRLSEIKKAKFIEPIFVDTMTRFYIKVDENKEGIKLNGKVLKMEKIIAKISLVLQPE